MNIPRLQNFTEAMTTGGRFTEAMTTGGRSAQRPGSGFEPGSSNRYQISMNREVLQPLGAADPVVLTTGMFIPSDLDFYSVFFGSLFPADRRDQLRSYDRVLTDAREG